MAYSYGTKSLAELQGVNPKLVAVTKLALVKSGELGFCDWTVHDGIRTLEQQKHYVAIGASRTMKSKHLDGLAVDLVPWIDGKPRWWWPQIYQIASCMWLAARELAAPIRWGVVWDRALNDLCAGVTDPQKLPDALKNEGLAYNVRHAGSDFPDGPHYELIV
jgi:peptidoglycan LD-endopeptidase CwlK